MTKRLYKMPKPTKQMIFMYNYDEIINYIEDKYSINVRDYYGKFSSKGQPWNGNGDVPYADFWHWLLEYNNDNRSYVCIPEEIEDVDFNRIPQFVVEIVELLKKEFGDNIVQERLWIDD